MDIGPSGNEARRGKGACIRALDTDSEEGRNKILSMKTVESESSLIDRNHLFSVSLGF